MSGTLDATPSATSFAACGTVLGFDFGTRKIGVALGNTITGTARPLVTLRAQSKSDRLAAIGVLIADWQPVVLVVGRPLHADGSAHAMTALADRFSRRLHQQFGIPVDQIDERYTTQVAQFTAGSGQSSASGDPGRDAVAAQLILQAWLDTRPPNPVPTS